MSHQMKKQQNQDMPYLQDPSSKITSKKRSIIFHNKIPLKSTQDHFPTGKPMDFPTTPPVSPFRDLS